MKGEEQTHCRNVSQANSSQSTGLHNEVRRMQIICKSTEPAGLFLAFRLTQYAVLHYSAIITLYYVNQCALYPGKSHPTNILLCVSI